MTGRILFVCAQKSSRALLAASLLHAQGMSLLPSNRLIQPLFGQRWEQGIVLCSGSTDT